MIVGYVRVSTEEQAREGLSLEAQEQRIRAYCTAVGLADPTILVEAGKSARKVSNRPILTDLLERVRGGEVTALVVVKLDRLVRSTRHALDIASELRRCGTRLVSIQETIDTGTAFGTFFYTVLAALAQLESEQIGERTSAGMAVLTNRGEFLGKPPFGKRLAVDPETGRKTRLEWDPDELPAVRRMIELRRRGISYVLIAETLTREGYSTREGARAWDRRVVQGVVRPFEDGAHREELPPGVEWGEWYPPHRSRHVRFISDPAA